MEQLRNWGTDAARSEQAGQGSDETDEKNQQMAHRRMVARRGIMRNHGRNNNSPATGRRRRKQQGRPSQLRSARGQRFPWRQSGVGSDLLWEREMRTRRDKTGDLAGQLNWRSLFLGDPGAKFLCAKPGMGKKKERPAGTGRQQELRGWHQWLGRTNG